MAVKRWFLVAVLGVAACGTAVVHQEPAGQQGSSSVPSPTPASDPQAQARAEAQALVHGVQLPQSAQEVTEAPSDALTQPAQVVKASRSETATRYWIVPDTYEHVLAFVRTSEQSGHPYTGGGETTQRGAVLSGSAIFGPLVFSLAALPDGATGIRADAQVLWSPVRAAAQRVGNVISALVTAYNGEAANKVAQAEVTGEQAQHLADLVDQLVVAQDVARSCPADMGARQRVDFVRTDRSQASVDGFFCGGVSLQIPGQPPIGLDVGEELARTVDELAPTTQN